MQLFLGAIFVFATCDWLERTCILSAAKSDKQKIQRCWGPGDDFRLAPLVGACRVGDYAFVHSAYTRCCNSNTMFRMTRKQNHSGLGRASHECVLQATSPATCEKCGLTLPRRGRSTLLLRMFEASAGGVFPRPSGKTAAHMPWQF